MPEKAGLAPLISFFLLSSAPSAFAGLGCVRAQVERLIEKGVVTAIERRRALLPKIDLPGIRRRLEDAVAGSQSELYLPELKAEVRWAKASLKGILEAASQKYAIRPDEMRQLRELSALLGDRLQKLVDDPLGIPLLEWEWLSERYAEFADLNTPDWGYRRRRFNERWGPDPHRFNAGPIVSLRSALEAGYSASADAPAVLRQRRDHWLLLPSAASLDLPAMNEWIAEGALPLGLTDRPMRFDGRDPVNASEFRGHDTAHVTVTTPLRKTGVSLSPQEYFSLFRKWAAQVSAGDAELAKNLEVIWFYAYRETGDGRVPLLYGPSTIESELKRRGIIQTLEVRTHNAHDLGGIYAGKPPSTESLKRARDRLLKFAHDVQVRYR